ncbi:MAG: hypothetical protein U0794_23290 [Isosphaeraceae bacterium]
MTTPNDHDNPPAESSPNPAAPHPGYPLADAPHTIPVVGRPTPYALAPDPLRPDSDGDGFSSPRPEHRRYVGQILILSATALILGVTLRMPTQLEANDISRWCTVWSLIERGTYAIDDCPWQSKTQDKVKKPAKLAAPGPEADPLKRLEYALAPQSWKEGEAVDHFYSSKPPLLPTLIAGLVYPARVWTGVPLDRVVEQRRLERFVEKDVPGEPGKTQFVKETPPPVPWPAYVFYFKPVIILLNIVPMLIVLVLYARLLDRYADDDWSWFLCLFAGAFGTYLFAFEQTLNNHTVAAASAFGALYGFQAIWSGRSRSRRLFAGVGFLGAFTACNEIPALLFLVLLFVWLFVRFPGRCVRWFVPGAMVPLVAFLITQFLAFGQFRPVYEEFGTKSYQYEGSYWNTPLEMDWFNLRDKKFVDGREVEVLKEPYEVYLFHMTLGHHGVFSLTPIFLFSIFGTLREIVKRGRLSAVGWMTLLLTVAMLAFYTWNPKARNYGGSTQGLRWLFWLIPFWLMMLPAGVVGGARRPVLRFVTLALLAISVVSVGYAVRNPWSHPWLLDALEHLDLYPLVR